MELVQQRAIGFYWHHSRVPNTIRRHAELGDFGRAYRLRGRDILPYHLISEVEKTLGPLTAEARAEGDRLYAVTYQGYRKPIIDVPPDRLDEVPPKNSDPNRIAGL